MSLALILEIIQGVLKFPTEVAALIRLLSKSPDEKRQEILARVMAESDSLDKTGRPTWEN